MPFDFRLSSWGNPGNLNPVLRAARRLRQRGHRVRLLDEVAHRDEIQREGFRLYITVSGPKAPNTFTLAPGILLIPHADGVWGWK